MSGSTGQFPLGRSQEQVLEKGRFPTSRQPDDGTASMGDDKRVSLFSGARCTDLEMSEHRFLASSTESLPSSACVWSCGLDGTGALSRTSGWTKTVVKSRKRLDEARKVDASIVARRRRI